MLGWSPQQRTLFSETLRDIANVAAGAMVFGQFLSERAFSPWQALVGVAVWGTLVAAALASAGRKQP